MREVAALYVERGGCYYGVPGVDPWDAARDARLYFGAAPVIAHPPCERWGRYWRGAPGKPAHDRPGDDGGCFAAALASVRRWGGVLEHPATSLAWRAFDLPAPASDGSWGAEDAHGGRSCYVEQGRYGHRAIKPTLLYAVRVAWRDVPVDFRRTPPVRTGVRGEARRVAVRHAPGVAATLENMCRQERRRTPLPFRDLLTALARSVT